MNWIRCRSCASWFDGNRFTSCSVCGAAAPAKFLPLAEVAAAAAAVTPQAALPEVEAEAGKDSKAVQWLSVIAALLLLPICFPVSLAILICLINDAYRKPKQGSTSPGAVMLYGCLTGFGIIVLGGFALWFIVCIAVVLPRANAS